MALLPRWRYMTPEAKAIVQQTAVSVGLVVIGLILLRALIPWIVLGLVAWWIWSVVRRTP